MRAETQRGSDLLWLAILTAPVWLPLSMVGLGHLLQWVGTAL